jgi:hypothetical protein
MAAQSIVCGTCAAVVPYGRLSCPTCGELLASAAGGRRAATAARQVPPDVLYEADAGPDATVVDGQLSLEPGGRDLDAELPWTSEVPATTAGIAADGPDAPAARAAWPDDVVDLAGADDDGLVAPAGDADGSLDDIDDAGGLTSSTAGPSWALAGMSLGGSPTPSYMPRPGLGPAAAPAAFAGPGAYVPPMPAAAPAAAVLPARAWVGHAAIADAPAVPDQPVADPAPASVDLGAERRARFAEFVGWLSVAGAAFAAVGFLLPWGMVMIGASGVGYFDRWGMAGPGHLLIVLGVLATLVLAFVRNPVPVWIRTGVVGLGLGSLLFGLVWPYLVGPLGSGPGVLIVAVGAAALAVSGVLALIADRHAEADRAV